VANWIKNLDGLSAAYDPYDPWMTRLGLFAKKRFYAGKLDGKLMSVGIAVVDWLFPTISRRLLGSAKHVFPITIAQHILKTDGAFHRRSDLEQLMSVASSDTDRYGAAWGLGFPWMSKNGLYSSDTPFVTHSPYALEALLALASGSNDSQATLTENDRQTAERTFMQSRHFLDALKVMHDDGELLALSYAPVNEPRIVVNANSYAAFAYALHARHSADNTENTATDRAARLARWVVAQQLPDGGWRYYADQLDGNFIDCFHSCFILKNLRKTASLLPQLNSELAPVIERGERYLDRVFFDADAGLVRRFVERDIKDPFVWDLYDQAEYLGLLISQNRIDDALRLLDTARRRFVRRGAWYCRIDFFGRRWGKDFLRWGIMPLAHQAHRLQALGVDIADEL